MTEHSVIVCETADRVLSVESGDSISGAAGAWQGAVETGLHRLLVSEPEGGLGDDFETAAMLASRYGAHAQSIPLLDVIVCNWIFSHAGLPITDAPAVFVPGASIEARVAEDHTLSWKRHFHVPMVVGAPQILIALELSGGPSIAVLDSSLPNAMTTSLAGEPYGRIGACSAVLPLALVPLPSGLPSVLDLAALLKAAAIAGALERILELTVSYANSRVQFGRPIGQFQAVQHMISRMSGETVAASVAIREAARMLGGDRGPFAVATAKAFIGEIAGTLPTLAHQVHGAIGYCEEFVLHRLTRRIWSWREQMGDEIYWQEALGSLILDNREDLWHVLTDDEHPTARRPESSDAGR
jgi:acyl-CoA dehydrogenase